MGVGFSSPSCSTSLPLSCPTSTCFAHCPTAPKPTTFAPKSQSNLFLFHSTSNFLQSHFRKLAKATMDKAPSSAPFSLRCGAVEEMEAQKDQDFVKPSFDPHSIDPELVQKMAYDALVWSSLHGLLVGERNSQRSGKVPGVDMVHAPFALLPMSFPESHWKQACEVSPIFNELVDRVSLDGNFLQDSLSRTKKVDAFTSRLLDIHSKMLEINKKEEIRLGLHRSDYMLDEQTKLLLQIELNTISSSFPGLSCLVSDLHRYDNS